MSDLQHSRLPVWFWAIAGAALIWNLFGVVSYIGMVTMSDEELAAMTEAERALIEGAPAWATGLFAIAVFSGVAGCVLLLLRKRLATPLFGVSLASVVLQMFWWIFLTSSIAVYGASVAVMPSVVIAIAVFLFWFSMSAKGKGWLA